MTRVGALLAAGVLTVLAPHDSAAAGAACLASTVSDPGILAARELHCHALATASGQPVSTDCLERARSRFLAHLSRGGCLDSTDIDALRSAAEALVADAVNALTAGATTGTGRCVGKKLDATGRAAKRELVCHARALRKVAPVSAACLGKATDRLASDWAKAEAQPPCATSGDEGAIATRVEDFVNEIVGLRTPDPSIFQGVYDVDFEFSGPYDTGPNDGPLGVARPGTQGELTLDILFRLYDELFLSGRPTAGAFPVEGYFIESGDIYYEARGSAAATPEDPDHITGSADVLSSDGTVRTTVEFTLSRPAGGTPASLGGAYRFAFPQSPSGCQCASETTLDLTVPADGFGTSAPATDARPDSTPVGTLAAGDCLVSPGGSVRCQAGYDAVDDSGPVGACERAFGTCPLVLQGVLPGAGRPSGAGQFHVGGPPPFVSGFWTVTR